MQGSVEEPKSLKFGVTTRGSSRCHSCRRFPKRRYRLRPVRGGGGVGGTSIACTTSSFGGAPSSITWSVGGVKVAAGLRRSCLRRSPCCNVIWPLRRRAPCSLGS